MTGCSCFASALQISERLHAIENNLEATSFDRILMLARQGCQVCRRYVCCEHCNDPSYFNLYVIILRKAAACYNHLIGQAFVRDSPGSSSASSHGSSSGWSSWTTQVRIGSYQVDAPLDNHTRTLLLRTEVNRAAQAVEQLDRALGADTVKLLNATSDATTLQYHHNLVHGLRIEFGNIEASLKHHDVV